MPHRRFKSRTPRLMYTMTCHHCGKPFTGFRKTARFCCPNHRYASTKKKSREAERQNTIKRLGGSCKECGKTEGLFIRTRPGEKTPVLLCGTHHSALSRALFRVRVHDAGKGYARRARLKKDMERDALVTGD